MRKGGLTTGGLRRYDPSMGPQLDSCGKGHALAYQVVYDRPSMGPQLDSCGKIAGRVVPDNHRAPSMGPQLDSCGKRNSRHRSSKIEVILQWGRNLTVAESHRLGYFGRGARREPSMGPQLDSCGKRRPLGARHTRLCLQWGRNLTVAESGSMVTMVVSFIALQWGRNLTVAESDRRRPLPVDLPAFNGAAT